ncbi:MAG: hypothetical protein K2X03_07835 [Bryobacteraceae bacterium]|nr:hypothetical protein [Bryobacteraceae bacterium]
MELVAGLDTQIFVIFLGVVVALGCTLVAFLVDYLKGKNERLREQVLEMTVRQEERARHPQAALESAAVITAITQVGKTLESVIRESMHSQARSAPAQDSGSQAQAEPNTAHRNQAESMNAPAAEPPPVYQARPLAPWTTEVPISSPLADAEVPLESTLASAGAVTLAAEITPAAEILKAEPDWRQASWHAEPVAEQAPEPLLSEEPLLSQEPVASEETVVTEEPVREALRSLFDSPASLAKAAQLEMQRHLDEPVPELAPEAVAGAETAGVETNGVETNGHEGEPVVRIRVLNQPATPAAEEIEEPVAEHLAEPQAEPVFEETPVAEAEELLPVTAPVDFLTADLGETTAPAPHESFDSLMAAVHEEAPMVEVPEEPVASEEPGVLALPSGMNDRATLDFLKRDKSSFTGLIVSIGINDYARLQEASGRPAAEELAKSVQQLVKSLITAPNGSEFFGCRSADDEFVLVFAGESGSAAQRRLNGLSERLWDFQLRSLGNFSVMFSWGATEANGEVFEDAVEAASERMRETRQNRRTVSMDKTRLKKVG